MNLLGSLIYGPQLQPGPATHSTDSSSSEDRSSPPPIVSLFASTQEKKNLPLKDHYASSEEEEAEWVYVKGEVEQAFQTLENEFYQIDYAQPDTAQPDTDKIQKKTSRLSFHLPNFPKPRNKEIFSDELLETILKTTEAIHGTLTSPWTSYQLHRAAPNFQANIFLHPSFLKHWGALASQYALSPLTFALDSLLNQRLKTYTQRITEEELTSELTDRLIKLGKHFIKGKLTTHAFDRQFILLTQKLNPTQTEAIDIHRRFLSEREQTDSKVRINETIRLIGHTSEQIALFVQREQRDQMRFLPNKAFVTTNSSSSTLQKAFQSGSIGSEVDALSDHLGDLLKIHLSPAALSRWYTESLAPKGIPNPKTQAILDATKLEASQISAQLAQRLILQSQYLLKCTFQQTLTLLLSCDLGAITALFCPIIEKHFVLHMEGDQMNSSQLHPCAEFNQGEEADTHFLRERILPHLGPLLFRFPTLSEGLIHLLLPELHTKMQPLLQAQNKTARTLQELTVELGDRLMLAAGSTDLLTMLDHALSGAQLAELVIKTLEPKWKAEIAAPEKDESWKKYESQKRRLTSRVLAGTLTEDLAKQKQASLLIPIALQVLLSKSKGLSLTGLNTTIAMTALQLFRLLNRPQLRRSLLYELVEELIKHVRRKVSTDEEMYRVLNRPLDSLRDQLLVTDVCTQKLVLLGTNLLSEVANRHSQSSSILGRFATSLASKLNGPISRLIRGSALDKDMYTVVNILLQKTREALGPVGGLESWLKEQAEVSHDKKPHTSPVLRRSKSCSNLHNQA